ncbi:hypothetical protein HAX54_041627 [Datura stramonium]|uniref:Uncharacterized protein n=1 Tax=Datura stramonium TaxID=4076 RepID=A0ABS8VZJ0_DATST|nr:hypothetical protein [Datura stramonium]
MSEDSAAGPDGYSGKFFQVYWEIIKEDVMDPNAIGNNKDNVSKYIIIGGDNHRKIEEELPHTVRDIIVKVDIGSNIHKDYASGGYILGNYRAKRNPSEDNIKHSSSVEGEVTKKLWRTIGNHSSKIAQSRDCLLLGGTPRS